MNGPKRSFAHVRRGRGKPEAPAWLIDNIAELSRSARTLYVVYISFLIYCILTTLTTPDRKFVLDQEVHLPIINLDIPLSVFVLTAPLVAIFVYLYFQLYLQTLRETIRRLRKDFARLGDGRLYPWMINLVEEPEPGLLGMIRGTIIKVSLWLMLPVTLILFTFFVLRKHEPLLAFYEWASSVVGTVLVLWLWRRYERGGEAAAQPAPNVSRLERWLNTLVGHWQSTILGASLLLFEVFLLLMIPQENLIKTGWFNVNLSNEALAEEKKYAGDWVDLHDVHLERANLSNAFMERANLRGAHMEFANLQHANLTNAVASDAHLNEAVLAEANLTEANLSGADLSRSNLNCAKLLGADLREATLTDAYLIGADLTKLPEGVREGVVSLFAGVKSLSHANFLDPEVEARLRAAYPKLFADIESSSDIVNRLAPNPNVKVVIFANGVGQIDLLKNDSYRFNREKRIDVTPFRNQALSDLLRDQPAPDFKLLATPEQAKFIRENLPELKEPLATDKDGLKSLHVDFVSEVTPVLVRAHHNTYSVEEIFVLVNDPSLPPANVPLTLWVFARSREVLIPCIR